MKKIFSKEVLIGIAVMVSLAVLFFGIDYLKGVNVFKPANFYLVSFNNVEGLAVSAPVTINGYQVGLVRDIQYEYENNGHMIIELSLNKELKLPIGTKALLATDMLGTSIIQLQLSDEKKYYKVGDQLIGENSRGLMDDLEENLMPAMYNILPKIDSILTSLNQIVANPALTTSITRLDNITANIERSSAQLAKIMGKSVPQIMTNVNGISTSLNNITTDLNQVSADLKKLPLESTMANIHSTTVNLNEITAGINSKNSTLGLLIHDRGLYDHLDSTVSSLDSVLIDLRLHPKKYVNFKLF